MENKAALLAAITLALAVPLSFRGYTDQALQEPPTDTPPITAYMPVFEAKVATHDNCQLYDERAVTALAQTVWGEARGCTETEQAGVVWCVLNRTDDPAFPDNILDVLKQPHQFYGYDPTYPVDPEIEKLVEDVLARWVQEKVTGESDGRVLPREYVFFTGDGLHNHFQSEWQGCRSWDWSLPSPYEEGC